MATVQPIKDKEMIEHFKREAMKQSYRDYMIALFGFNTGLRIGDIVPLQVKDVRDKTHIVLQEQKTKKAKRMSILSIKVEIDDYIKDMADDDYLFESRQVDSDGVKRNISTTQAYRALKKIANKCGIEEFGTHSLRKSFGYHYYQMTNDLVMLMDIFNHSSLDITKRYIGIRQEEIDNSLEGFYL